MKNLFFGLIATVLFTVTGFANNIKKESNNPIIEKNELIARSCRNFTVEVSVGIVSISTEVTICIVTVGPRGGYFTISRISDSNIYGYIKVEDIISSSKGKIDIKNVNEIEITNSNVVDFDGVKYKVVKKTGKTLEVKDTSDDFEVGSYIEVVLEKN